MLRDLLDVAIGIKELGCVQSVFFCLVFPNQSSYIPSLSVPLNNRLVHIPPQPSNKGLRPPSQALLAFWEAKAPSHTDADPETTWITTRLLQVLLQHP